jgi:hypothetical protein
MNLIRGFVLPGLVGFGLLGLTSCSLVGSWFAESDKVAQEEFGPRATLKKYEWFKDAYHHLQGKKGDIALYEATIAEYERVRLEEPSKWNKANQEDYNQLKAELRGVKASYNDLAAEYNSHMSKFNHQFANVDVNKSLPEKVDYIR